MSSFRNLGRDLPIQQISAMADRKGHASFQKRLANLKIQGVKVDRNKSNISKYKEKVKVSKHNQPDIRKFLQASSHSSLAFQSQSVNPYSSEPDEALPCTSKLKFRHEKGPPCAKGAG